MEPAPLKVSLKGLHPLHTLAEDSLRATLAPINVLFGSSSLRDGAAASAQALAQSHLASAEGDKAEPPTRASYLTLVAGTACTLADTDLLVDKLLLLRVPEVLAPATAVSIVTHGLPALMAVHYHLGKCSGATVLVLNAADPRSRCAAQLVHWYGGKLLLRCETKKERASLGDWAPASALLLNPEQQLLEAVMEATGELGVDAVLDISGAACLSGLSRKLLRPAVRDLLPQQAQTQLPSGGAADSSSSSSSSLQGAAVLSHAAPPSSAQEMWLNGSDSDLPALDILLRCLGLQGRLITSRPDLELDPVHCTLLRCKQASLHFLYENSWLESSLMMGKMLHLLQELLELAAAGHLSLPVKQHSLGSNVSALQSMAAGLLATAGPSCPASLAAQEGGEGSLAAGGAFSKGEGLLQLFPSSDFAAAHVLQC